MSVKLAAMAARLALVAMVLAGLGCGSAASSAPAEEDSTTSSADATTNGASDTSGGEAGASTAVVTPPLSSVPECDVYLHLYQRCEPTLAPSIAAGDRRDFEHERGWLEYMSTTPEVAAMPDACRDMTRELQAVCP